MYQEIKNRDIDWDKLYRIVIQDNNEPLVKVIPTSKLILKPIYYERNIENASADFYLRETVLEKLLKVSDNLPAEYGLVLFDAWRSRDVQYYLREAIGKTLREQKPHLTEEEFEIELDYYVAKPSFDLLTPSPHSTGAAVDLSIFSTQTGEIIEMGSEFDESSPRSHTHYYEGLNDETSLIYRDLRRMLVYFMEKEGFVNFPSEWWHFSYGDQDWVFLSHKEFAQYGYIDK